MKINAVIIPKRTFKPKEKSLPFNKNLLIITAILSVAALSGVLLYIIAKSQIDVHLSESFNFYTQSFIKKSKPEMFSGLLLEGLPYFFLMLLFSTSVIGDVFIYTLSFIKVLGLSTCITYIYSVYELKGIEYCLLVLLPGKFFLILGILLLINCCSSIIKTVTKRSKEFNFEPKNIAVKTVAVLIILLISSTVELLTTSMFSDLFAF